MDTQRFKKETVLVSLLVIIMFGFFFLSVSDIQEPITGATTSEPVKPQALTVWVKEDVFTGVQIDDLAADIDSADYIHVGYVDITNGEVTYVENTGGSWSNEIIDTNTGTNSGEFQIALVIDDADIPHVAYLKDNTQLNHGIRITGTWFPETIRDGLDFTDTDISLASDDSSIEHVSFYIDAGADDFRLYRGDNSLGWATSEIYPSASQNSIAVDSLGTPSSAYFDSVNFDLMYEGVQVDSAGDVGRYPYLTIDSSDNKHVSYSHAADGPKYAKYDGSWTTELIESGITSKHSSVITDSSDNPHVAYFDSTNNDLKYATKVGGSWEITTVDSTGTVGEYPVILLDSTATPHIIYYDTSNQNIKHTYKSTSTEPTEGADLDEGSYTIANNIYGTQSGKDYCFGFTTDNVYLDCNDYNITGNASNTIAFLINNTNNQTIIDCPYIFNYTDAFRIINASNIYIKNLHIEHNVVSINITNSNNITINNVTLENNTYGIYTINLTNSSITENEAQSSPIKIGSDGNIISYNLINNSYKGIDLEDSNHNIIMYNNLTNNTYSIFINNSRNNTIHNNIILESNYGLYQMFSEENNMYSNTIANNTYGIYSYNSNDSIFNYNQVLNNTINTFNRDSNITVYRNNFEKHFNTSLKLDNQTVNSIVENNTLHNYNISNNSIGIHVAGSINISLINNTITGFGTAINITEGSPSAGCEASGNFLKDSEVCISIQSGVAVRPHDIYNNWFECRTKNTYCPSGLEVNSLNLDSTFSGDGICGGSITGGFAGNCYIGNPSTNSENCADGNSDNICDSPITTQDCNFDDDYPQVKITAAPPPPSPPVTTSSGRPAAEYMPAPPDEEPQMVTPPPGRRKVAITEITPLSVSGVFTDSQTFTTFKINLKSSVDVDSLKDVEFISTQLDKDECETEYGTATLDCSSHETDNLPEGAEVDTVQISYRLPKILFKRARINWSVGAEDIEEDEEFEEKDEGLTEEEEEALLREALEDGTKTELTNSEGSYLEYEITTDKEDSKLEIEGGLIPKQRLNFSIVKYAIIILVLVAITIFALIGQNVISTRKTEKIERPSMKEYATKTRDAGYSRQAVKQALKNVGWSEKVAESALKDIETKKPNNLKSISSKPTYGTYPAKQQQTNLPAPRASGTKALPRKSNSRRGIR